MKQGTARYIVLLTLILLGITAVVAALLGLVNQITADKITAITAEKTANAMAQVLSAENYTEIMYLADDKGYVLQTTVSGSQGMITLMVGVDCDGAVTGISIIDHGETPGLGAVYAQDSAKGNAFRDSLVGLQGTVTTEDVDYISGATVTANAICTAVSAATACVAAYVG